MSTTETTKKPFVLFVCVHNAGRSQMAAAYLTTLSQGAIEVRSAGSQPASSVNPSAPTWSRARSTWTRTATSASNRPAPTPT